MRIFPTLAASLALACALHTAHAQDAVTIYRCTAADGSITVQNDTPCPKGQQQDKRVLQGVPTAPPPPTLKPIVPASPTPAPAAPVPVVPAPPPTPASTAAPVITAAERLPPPALYECRSYDNSITLTETSDPQERCAPLQTTGLGGSNAQGAGAACQVTTDTCTRVAETEVCNRWQQRLRDAQTAERFGNDAGRSAAQADIARAETILRESTCANG